MAYEDYTYPTWVSEGMEVYAPYPQPNRVGCALKCKVSVAAGNHAQVVNEKYNFRKWFDIYDLRVLIKKPEPTGEANAVTVENKCPA